MDKKEIENGEVLETFDWYDGPLNYTLKGVSGQLYYGTLIDDREIKGRKERLFMVMPTNESRLNQLLSGEVDIREFHKNETANGAYVESNSHVQFYSQEELSKVYPLDEWSAEPGVRYDKKN